MAAAGAKVVTNFLKTPEGQQALRGVTKTAVDAWKGHPVTVLGPSVTPSASTPPVALPLSLSLGPSAEPEHSGTWLWILLAVLVVAAIVIAAVVWYVQTRQQQKPKTG